MEDKYKIIYGTTGYDPEKMVAHYIVPISKPTQIKGNWKIINEHFLIDSDFNFWAITSESQQEKNQYLQSAPNFPIGKIYWDPNDIKKFVSTKGTPKIDPYTEVFEPIHELLKENVDFHDPLDSLLITIWTMGTYLQPIFDAYPYLFLSGTRGSGKTKVLELVSRLAFNAEMTSNSTPSSIFRLIQANSSTLLIDEGEMLSSRDDSPELKLILNAGYKRNNPVSRTNKDSHQVEWFNVFSPKMIAAINPLDQTLRSRCLQITMVRTGDKNKGNKRINDSTVSWACLKNTLYRYGLQCMSEIKEVFEHDEEINVLQCRQNELWAPILAIAKHLNLYVPATVFEQLQVRAIFQNQEDEALDDWHKAVLSALHDLVKSTRDYSVKEIKYGLSKYIDDPGELEKMSSRWIGAALSRFGLKRGRRQEDGNTYLISREEVIDLAMRYQLSIQSELPEHTVEERSKGVPPTSNL